MHFFEWVYYAGFSIKKWHASRNRRRLPCRVISIGNLTLGGTGKTPATIALAEEAAKRGLRPVILTRGYGGDASGPCFVTRGEGPLLSADEAGDEPVLMAERLRGVPVVKAADRYEGGLFAMRELGVSNHCEGGSLLFILDDGFQHWGLYRDKDIVLVDAVRPFGNGMLLPFGRLREPVGSVARAGVIALTKTENPLARAGEAARQIRRYNDEAAIFFARHEPSSCRDLSGASGPVDRISGKKVFGFCALADPESFRNTLMSRGAELKGFRAFRDHYRYRQRDIDVIDGRARDLGVDWIVTTEKDIMKLRNLVLPENILIMEVVFSAEDAFYEAVFT